LSRAEIHQQTGVRPNTIGADAAALIRAGFVRERDSLAAARGRPRVPLELDPERKRVLGVAIRPGAVQLSCLNLLGTPIDGPITRAVSGGEQMILATRELLAEHADKRCVGVGVTTPGFVDPISKTILFSSATVGGGPVQLAEALQTSDQLPVALENDMHALAARWMLTRLAGAGEDVLLIYFDDGQLGAALLIDGRPNRGCVTGANEIGHTRLPVDTDVCYCGHAGCLERICSTPFARRLTRDDRTLGQVLGDADSPAASRVIDLLSTGFANAVNFMRVHRLILVSQLLRHRPLADALVSRVAGKVLPEIATRVKIDPWEQPATNPAEDAGWLALASLYFEGWNR